MAKNAVVLAVMAVVVAAVLVAEAKAACDPMQLMPCAGAFLSGSNPSSECCAKLREQKPCLCEYKKNPQYQSYVTSPSAKRIATACQVTVDC